MGADEQVLAGGLGNEGRVVRVGDSVRRPVGPWTPAVHLLLAHLEQSGFDGAPRVLGREADIEVLEFKAGAVAVPPFPAWAASDDPARQRGRAPTPLPRSCRRLSSAGRRGVG